MAFLYLHNKHIFGRDTFAFVRISTFKDNLLYILILMHVWLIHNDYIKYQIGTKSCRISEITII
jgi:hypothetical protein